MQIPMHKYPASYTYNQVLDKIKSNRIAYCYTGDRAGSILVSTNGSAKIFNPIGNVGNYADTKRSSELWAFIDEIYDKDFRSSAVNNLFNVYCNHYNILLSYDIDLFKNI